MITFNLKPITVPEELAQRLAIDFGYKQILTKQIEVVSDDPEKPLPPRFEMKEYENPETYITFLERELPKRIVGIILPTGHKIVKEEVAKAGFEEQQQALNDQRIKTEESAYEQIIKPIVESIVVEVSLNDKNI